MIKIKQHREQISGDEIEQAETRALWLGCLSGQ
jgi:hypothetical protein